MEPVAGKSGWDRELEETTNLKAMVGIELLYTRTLLQTSREIRNDIIQSHGIALSCGSEQSVAMRLPEISTKVNAGNLRLKLVC